MPEEMVLPIAIFWEFFEQSYGVAQRILYERELEENPYQDMEFGVVRITA